MICRAWVVFLVHKYHHWYHLLCAQNLVQFSFVRRQDEDREREYNKNKQMFEKRNKERERERRKRDRWKFIIITPKLIGVINLIDLMGFTLNWGWTTTRMSIHIFWIWGIFFSLGWVCENVKNGIENFDNNIVEWEFEHLFESIGKVLFSTFLCVCLLLLSRAQYSIGCKLILIRLLNEMAKQCSKRQMPVQLAFMSITWIAFIFHFPTNSISYVHTI